MIAVVTDSTSQLTPTEAAAAGIDVVPLTVTIDGSDHLEGIDLTAEDFYDRLDSGIRLETSQPSPGRFADTYRRLAAGGASEIVSVHLAEEVSGTLNSARIASELVGIPVHLIDSRMTSYGLGALTRHLASFVRRHGTAGVQHAAAEMIEATGMVFTLPDLGHVARGGRMRIPELPDGSTDIPVLGGYGGRYDLLGVGRSVDELVDVMTRFLSAGDHLRRVAIAHAAPETIVFTEALERRMRASELVDSVHRYRLGPSVAVHAGPGTAGGFVWPAP